MRLRFLILILFATLVAWVAGPLLGEETKPVQHTFKVQHSDEGWRQLLTPEQYQILRKKGTERRNTSECTLLKDEGDYYCVGCGNLLFSSEGQFHSGTGWPSFVAPAPGAVVEETDTSYGMRRTEVLCADCSGHLGHVFPDGPPPTGLRYCINGKILKFVPKEKEKK